MHLRILLGVVLGLFAATVSSGYNFAISTLQGVALTNTTSLQFGPDHRLYVAQVNGQILALTVQRLGPNNYQVTATETINLVRDIPNYDDSGARNFTLTKRQVTGLLVTGTPANPVLYVTSSDPRIGGGSGGENDLNLDTNSGILSRLTKSGSTWTKVDLVRGLPRSEENHASNGMQLDAAANRLYLAQGGNTNAGGPSINFAYMCETALAAAILSIDLNAINALPVKTDAYGQKYLYNLPTLDDPNPSRSHNPDGSDVHDPFGGNDGLNQAKLVEGGPVQIYSPGHRNPYDLVLTRTPGNEGRLYTFDNGANVGWGGYPHNEGPSGTVTNQYVTGEPGPVNDKDGLYLVTPGFYRGHPNPIRANPAGAGWFYFDNTKPDGEQKIYSATPTTDWPPVPLSMANPVEGDFRMPGVADGALMTYTESTNGLTEYVATNFNGEMRGNLIAATYDGKLLRIALNASGTAVTNGVEFLAAGFGTLPLDVTTPDPGHGADFVGTIWVAHYSPAKISILEPADFDSPGGPTCTGINSFEVDEDGDGFSNADEIANDSDPCSGAIMPPDADADHVSDLLDTDDDNDGLADTHDPFPIDSRNGYSVPLPVHYELFNETGIGFYGVGFTGVMMNPGSDYLPLRSADNVIAGGTAGLFTIAHAGTGTARAGTNTQKDAYQFAFNSDEFTTAYVITARLGGPFFASAPTGNQRHGIYLGSGDQDNYVSLALHANSGGGGIEVVYESAGAIVSEQIYALPNMNDSATIDLSFLVDPLAATVQPRYQLADAPSPVPLGLPIAVSGEVLASLLGPDPLAIGLFANTGGGPDFSATWDYFDIAPLPTTAIAKVTIDPSGSNMATSSTFNSGSFKIENLSTGGVQIEQVDIDISTAILPDLVFDTTGSAGDAVAKNFTPNTVSSGVVMTSGGAVRPHNGVDSDDGFDAVAIDFSAFPPSGTFSFSIDIDPNNVKGVPQPGERDSASVSGLDLVGTTATIYFSDGSVHRTRVGRVEASVDGSYGWLRATKPPRPDLRIASRTSPFQTGQSAQTVRVSGPAGLTVSLVIAEAGLYLEGAPGGGYNVQPYDANTVIKVTEYAAAIGPEGFADIPVTLTKSEPKAGYNFITATLQNTDDIKGPASTHLLAQYDPAFGGGDTQPPTEPGNLATSSITSRSVSLSWSASNDNVGVAGYDVFRNGTLVTSTFGLTFTDVGLDANQSYDYSVVARDEAGNLSPPATTSANTPPNGTVLLRVNAGGPQFVDSHGATWSADTGFNTGTTSTTTLAIDRAVDDTLFKSRRLDSVTAAPDLAYAFTVPNGNYEVQLFFAENDTGNSATGKRVFDVLLEGQLTFDNFDIFAAAGAPYTAVVVAASATVSDGQLDVLFSRVAGNPQVNAIKVIQLDAGAPDTLPPTTPGPLVFSNVTAGSVTLDWTASNDDVGVTGYRITRNGEIVATVPGLTYTDTGLAAATTYAYSVVALDAAGNLSSASSGSVTTASGGGTTPAIRINAGGAQYTDTAGKIWAADTGYNTGKAYAKDVTVTGTAAPNLFDTERYQRVDDPPLTYTFNVQNGSYLVRLHEAETYAPTKGAGLRVFDVDVQGVRAFEDVDIFVLAGGGNQALVLEHAATVTNGQLTIQFHRQVENPKVNAIEIVAQSGPEDTEPPTTPAGLAAGNVTTSGLSLSWTASTDNVGVTGYRISRDGALLATVTGTSFDDTGLTPSTTYNYSVVALDAAGNVSPPATTSATTTASSDTQPPTAPGPLTFTNVTATSVTANWTAATDNVGVTGYRISRGATVLGTTAALTYADTGLTPATTYTYNVVALDAAGNESSASTASVATASGGPPAGTLRINAGGPQYTDTVGQVWAADTGYNTGKAYANNVTVSGTTAPDLFDTERYERVGDPPLTYTFTVPNGACLVRLHEAETYASTKGAGLRVFDIDIQGERAFEDVDIFVLAGGSNKALVLEHTANVTNGQLTIQFHRQVENPKINAIEIIPQAPPTDSQPPTAPANLAASDLTASSLTLSWTASTDNVGVTGYHVSRDGALLATVTDTSFADSGLSPSTTYNYSVVAIDAADNESTAATASATTAAATDTQPPTPPGALTFTNVTASSVTVNWTAATDNVGVTGYRVSRGATVLTTTTALTYTDSGLTPATTYTYDVVALDAAGNESSASSASVATASGGPPPATLRINTGGPAYTDTLGNLWTADTGYNTGKAASETVTVTGTTAPGVFRTNRFDEPASPELMYTFALANGSYQVRLHFAETYGPNKAPGARVFDINIQGALAFDNVDIYTLAGGGNQALVLEHPATVTTGQLTIQFVHQVNNPRVNAIEIVPVTP